MSLLTKRTCFRGNKWGDKGGQTKAPPTGIAVTLNQRGAEKGIQISPPLKEGSTQIQENTMAQDKNYGSGKSVTANASRSRARVAAGRFTKGKKRAVDNLVSKVGEVADFAFNGPKETRGKYAELGVSANKLSSVAKALFNSGKSSAAEAVGSRLYAKRLGSFRAKNISGRSGKTPVSNLSPRLLGSAQRVRVQSESMFPRSGGTTGTASARLQKVADTITKRHYKDVSKKGLGHGDAVNMPRARVLRNLKDKRGIQINKPRGR